MKENKDQNEIIDENICLKCHEFFTQTQEFSLTPENDFNFLLFNFCDECRNSVNIDDFIGPFSCWTSNWLEEYIKNDKGIREVIEN